MYDISGYEMWLTQEKRASANTLSSYLRDVRQFSLWVEEEGMSLSQVGQDDVRRPPLRQRHGETGTVLVGEVSPVPQDAPL